ncbi:beta-glucan synthesis-associated protein KRE6 [Coprinellus micaceus]|uniref:Beta-glucan synthesis-associated protein KRE6 n=1 Tax=Coprinellus micaceus TaxID=71717 RepID=A0A4Y7RTX7_COPMI|nr:beta-glucan synthesis-associated protein KRE6 [Coprinellus micaceus]
MSSASLTSLHIDDNGSLNGHRIPSRTNSIASMSAKYSLAPSPKTWGSPLLMDTLEPDDFLHNPDPRRDRKNDGGGNMFTVRGLQNLGCLFILAMGLLSLFAVYPLVSHFTEKKLTTQGGFNLGGVNASGQIPDLPGNFGLIDRDTPRSAYTKKSYRDGEEFILVFSDEFEQDGRTFWPGDDPYWEAVDIHYWGTNDLEWYDPHQVTTKDGYLQIRMDKVADPSTNHNMEYRSGMLQSWNKFCFTGGLIEVSVRLPGSSSISGFWPGVWTFGNLGRAGYGASNHGTWPYSYDSCDIGTLPNQTYVDKTGPRLALEEGDKYNGGKLSFLPGQRLSACTCPGESHPGPVKSNGEYVGRSAPEIDMIEAIVENGAGHVSQSAQFAPFNARYQAKNDSASMVFYDLEKSIPNPYMGNNLQQCASGLGVTNQACYELSGGCFTEYGFEYKPGSKDGYITWLNSGDLAWTLTSSAMVADTAVEISERPIPQEPMYVIMNFGISKNFGALDFENLQFPGTMNIDYVRVYQPKNAVNTGCDPKDFPTAAYIETYKEAYTNYNLTTWDQYGQPWPKNRLVDKCT